MPFGRRTFLTAAPRPRLCLRRIALAAGLALLPAAGEAATMCRAAIQPAPPVNACTGPQRISIAAVGDVLLHAPLQRRGYASPDGFRDIWRQAEAFLSRADIAYANLEGPMAPGIANGRAPQRDPGPVLDGRVYSGYPLFNYHPRVAAQLKASGVDIVSTANNHAMDRGPAGADLTLAALEAAKLKATGTIRRGAPRAFVTYTPSPMGAVAWIACSYDTNGLSDPGRQVLLCYRDQAELLALIAREAGRREVGAVIVTPHWGGEYSHAPDSRQKRLARAMAAAGATAVLGAHPHVIQPWEWVPGVNGTQTLVVYSLGNFVSAQMGSLSRRTGALAWLELCRGKSGLVAAQAGWLPLVMHWTQAGPYLVAAGTGAPGQAAQGRALAARLLPAGGLKLDFVCTQTGG